MISAGMIVSANWNAERPRVAEPVGGPEAVERVDAAAGGGRCRAASASASSPSSPSVEGTEVAVLIGAQLRG